VQVGTGTLDLRLNVPRRIAPGTRPPNSVSSATTSFGIFVTPGGNAFSGTPTATIDPRSHTFRFIR